MRKSKFGRIQGIGPTAGELAGAFSQRLEGASYSGAAAALVSVLARWIAEHGERPVLDARAYGAALGVLVDGMVESAEEERVRDVAA